MKRGLFLLAYVALLLALTLTAVDSPAAEGLGLCLICGQRGLADAILNVLLFVPIGVALGPAGWLPVLAAGAAVSGGIELVQTMVPGRHPSVADVLFNTLGTMAGWGLARSAALWVDPSDYVGDRLATAAAIAAAGSMVLAGWLAQPWLPDPPYYVAWRLDLPPALAEEADQSGLADYPGQILSSGVQPMRLVPGTFAGEPVRILFGNGALLGVVVISGPASPDLAPLIRLYDPESRLVAMLAVDSTDLVHRGATNASRWRLDNPETRFRGALDSAALGDTVALATADAPGGRRCFVVQGRLSCGHDLSGANAWRFLYALNGTPASAIAALDALWLAVLLFPVGYWGRWHVAGALGAAVAAYAWLRAPGDTGLVPVLPIELLGVLAGALLGLLVRRWLRSRRAGSEQAPSR